MTIGFLFWLLMVITLIFGFVSRSRPDLPAWGTPFLLWVLLALLGWGIFGFPIRG
jgi:hypothetical protein